MGQIWGPGPTAVQGTALGGRRPELTRNGWALTHGHRPCPRACLQGTPGLPNGAERAEKVQASAQVRPGSQPVGVPGGQPPLPHPHQSTQSGPHRLPLPSESSISQRSWWRATPIRRGSIARPPADPQPHSPAGVLRQLLPGLPQQGFPGRSRATGPEPGGPHRRARLGPDGRRVHLPQEVRESRSAEPQQGQPSQHLQLGKGVTLGSPGDVL